MKRFVYYFSVVLYVLFIQNISLSQYQSVKINPVNTVLHSEQCLKINPKNPNQIVAGVMGNYSPLTTISGYYYSSDGGLNWNGGPVICSFAQPYGDPMVVVDTSGYFYYFCLANGTGLVLDKLLCFKSTNGGANWDGGTAFALLAPKKDDMEMACVDLSHSPYRNNIYVTFTLYDTLPSNNPLDSCYVMFCSSTNSGISFSVPKRISRIAGTARIDSSSPEGVYPCIGPNGEVYVTWPLNETIMFNRSTNAGLNWLANDIYVSNQVGGWRGLSGSTSMNFSPVSACDISNSPYSGTIYVCFADQRNGINDRDIWLVKSTNRGNNWSAPKRVNNDGPGNDQKLPWICVDKITGYVWIVFYDTRNNGITMSNTYIARSTDGGNTFQNVKISPVNVYNGFYLGEYISIDAYNNKSRILWAKPFNNNNFGSDSYCTIIDTLYTIGINTISEDIPSSYSLKQNYPNPFNPVTNIRFDIPKSSFVSIKIYDVTGKEVETIVNENMQTGKYETQWNGSIYSSGVYFYKITTGDFTATKRMVLIK